MTEISVGSLELLPESGPVQQLFILLHGVGGRARDLLPVATRLRRDYPSAAFLLPEGALPFDGGGEGRQWFSIRNVTEESRVARVMEALPALHAFIRQAQERFGLVPPDTALVGFSQGAIMSLEYSVAHDGGVGRVLAFSGRFAKLPETAPKLTTLYLFHGNEDVVIPVLHAELAFQRLNELQGDATLDIAEGVGHLPHEVLVERAVHRLRTVIPMRSWQNAMRGI